MINFLRRLFRKNLQLRRLFGYYLPSSGLFDKWFRNYILSETLQKRLNDILSCSDNNYINRVSNAGEIIKGKQIMHNGIKIHLGSYYGPEYSVVLQKSKGVHEPQEERVFAEVLSTMRSGALMLEMGAFWSFYSIWFNKMVKNAINYMIEPDSFNIGHGKRNFALNKVNGVFIQAFIGNMSNKQKGVHTLSVDDICEFNKIQFIDLLHCDIQGYEYEMLQGAETTIKNKKVGYIFISTHSDDVHQKCLNFLILYDFKILAAADMTQTFSEDGLIVARAKYYSGIEPVNISLKEIPH